ncbi:MAG: hypothetical protein HY720_30210 [Planctomycetes bacterium]|nr:hypothetical protein [Planctomycetota bacterium]
MHEATGEPRYLETARKAAWSTYVSGRFCRSGANQCHGVAGNAELLLQMDRVTGEAIYREWSEDSAELVIWKAHRDGDRVWWDEGDWGTGVRSLSYMVGSSGPASLLLSLHDPAGFPMPFLTPSKRRE